MQAFDINGPQAGTTTDGLSPASLGKPASNAQIFVHDIN